MLLQAKTVGKQFAGFLTHLGFDNPAELQASGMLRGQEPNRQLLVGVAEQHQLRQVFNKLFDEAEFLSPHGFRSISAYHRDHPYVLEVPGLRAEIDYEPAESTTSMFGGNSNWRGPIWLPLNYLLVSVFERYARFSGSAATMEYPTGSGTQVSLTGVIDDMWDRLISIFLSELTDGGRAWWHRTHAARSGLEGQHPVLRVLPRR
jgi:hypothetical protein